MNHYTAHNANQNSADYRLTYREQKLLRCDVCGKPATRREWVNLPDGRGVTYYTCGSCTVTKEA